MNIEYLTIKEKSEIDKKIMDKEMVLISRKEFKQLARSKKELYNLLILVTRFQLLLHFFLKIFPILKQLTSTFKSSKISIFIYFLVICYLLPISSHI